MNRGFSALFVVVLGLPMVGAGQTEGNGIGCQAPDSIRAEIREAGRVEREAGGKLRPFEELQKERRSRAEELLGKHPDNFWVWRYFVSASQENMQTPEAVTAKVQMRREKQPASVEAAYLYAFALIGTQTPKAIEILDEIAVREPRFAPVWQSRFMIFGSPAFQNEAKRKEAAEKIMDLCPQSLDALRAALQFPQSPKAKELARMARERMQGKEDEEWLMGWSTLWNLEFKLAPVPEHAGLREQVKRDLAFLETLDKARFSTLPYILAEGYKITGDKEKETATRSDLGTGFPMAAFFEASNEWYKKNQLPATGGPPEKRREFFQARLKFLDEWQAKLPEEEFIWADRLRTLSEIEDTSVEALREAGEKALALSRKKSAERPGSGNNVAIQVAEVWVKRGIEVERLPALVQEARAEQDKILARMNNNPDLFRRPDMTAMQQDNRWYGDVQAWRTLALAYAKLKQPEDAGKELANWESALVERRKRAAEIKKQREANKEPVQTAQGARTGGPTFDAIRMRDDNVLRSLPYDESRLLETRAEVALELGRKQDALQYSIAALRHSAAQMPSWEKHPTAEKIKKLWTELGGTQEGWQALRELIRPVEDAAGPAKRDRFVEFARTLPGDLSLVDLQGQTWTLARLRGKTTLINVWATWCGPCRQELPFLQKLHEQVKEREDLQVISFNVDESTGAVEPFMKENKYTFPVLLAKNFLDSFTGPLGIPTNWLSDRTGTLKVESVGFGGDGEQWMKEMLEKLESMREAPTTR
jgi:thiol-disulfide isomerase/thioredoxin